MMKIYRTKYTFGLFALLFSLFSCNSEQVIDDTSAIVASSAQVRVLLSTEDASVGYPEIYVFNGQLPKLDFYHHQILDMVRTPEYLKMKMPQGVWNAVIVSCNESNIHSQITKPEFNTSKSDMPMWVTQPAGGLLPEVPQIRTALVDGLVIDEDRIQNASAILERNVAKVRVVLKDGVGFRTEGAHTFSLKNVPTSLSWDGSLYPNKSNPTTSVHPMTKSVRLFSSQQEGHQRSDTIDFIIPAHKSLSVADTTIHKLTLGMKLMTLGATTFEKEVTIATVPKNNKVLLLNLTAKGGVEVAVEVAEWTTVSTTETTEMYKMSLLSADSKTAKYAMTMIQERNWWVTLADTDNFEFTETSRTFGQQTYTPASIEIRRKTSGQPLSTTLNLHIDGLQGLVEKYNVADLTL